ncbi:TPA: hypothetical protein ACH3X1_008030 [Trebouxia sp. C0004]
MIPHPSVMRRCSLDKPDLPKPKTSLYQRPPSFQQGFPSSAFLYGDRQPGKRLAATPSAYSNMPKSLLAEELNNGKVTGKEVAPLGNRVDPFGQVLLAQQLLQKRREMVEEHACGAMATGCTKQTSAYHRHQAAISKVLGLREQLLDSLQGTDEKTLPAVPQSPACCVTVSGSSADAYQGDVGLSALPPPELPPIKTIPERFMLIGPPINVSRSYGALPPPPLSSKAATPGSSPPEPHHHEQLCPLGLDTMSGTEFQVALPVSARPSALITAHAAPAQQCCEDSDTATARQTVVPGQPKSGHVRFDTLLESGSSPQGVGVHGRSLTPPAHGSMLPRHSLDSIQLRDALIIRDSSPAGTGRPKCKGSPRIKSRRSRSSKQWLPVLHTPLLADVPPGAHTSSGYQTGLGHSSSHDTAAADSTPLHRLKSGISAGWQQLCKAGRRVMAVGHKLCKKLLSALGMLAEEQAQSLPAEHQAEDIAALAVQPQGQLGCQDVAGTPQPHRAFQAHPQGRLLRWRM